MCTFLHAEFVSNPSPEAQAFTQSKVAVSCTLVIQGVTIQM